MDDSMRAAVLVEARRFEIRDVPRPVPASKEVLLRVDAVGFCGTDFHIFSGESNYNFDRTGKPIPLEVEPLILGHEVTGTVVELGASVSDLTAGQRVVVDQGLNCRSRGLAKLCEYCGTGDSHQCDRFEEYGITGLPGGMAEFISIPAINVIPYAPRLEPALAVMTEPLACVLHSSDMVARTNARYRLGDAFSAGSTRTVLICGAGPAGLFWVQVLRRVLGYEGLLLVSEPNAMKRALAERFGATGIDPHATPLFEAVRELTQGRMIEYLIEATGSGPLFLEIPGLLRGQGTLLLYGHGHGGVGLEALNQVQWKEPVMVSPIGASGGFDTDGRPSVYRKALRLIEESIIDVGSLVTHRYRGLEGAPKAFGGDHALPDYIKGLALL